MIAEVGRRGPKGDPGESGVVTYAAIGSVLYHAGTTPPAGYLVCDGTVYNIVDYPELAQFFADNYGSVNHWGGDGTATFAVPDWRGEFFRASGTNSHANQGNGAAVGQHQDATEINNAQMSYSSKRLQMFNVDDWSHMVSRNSDSRVAANFNSFIDGTSGARTTSTSDMGIVTPRPTNTSLLVCIKAKMVENMEEIVTAVVRQMSSQLDPVGKVIYYAGLTAPANYLACDGTVHNIADYPELAQFFAVNYGSANYWGGDGTTTFAVPDWRGEFFRASGTNSRANQGSGAAVGAHQDATQANLIGINSSDLVWQKVIENETNWPSNMDSEIHKNQKIGYYWQGSKGNDSTGNFTTQYTSRPTNTSLLVCIKAA